MEDTELQRGQFTFFGSYFNAINRLPKCRQLELFQAICRYAFYGELPLLTGSSAAVFDMVVPSLKAGRVKSAARLKELEDVENLDLPGGSDKNKNKNKNKNNNKEKDKDKDNGGACAPGPASFREACVFDRYCSDDPVLAEALRTYVSARRSVRETVTEEDAKRLYDRLMQLPAHERLNAVEYSTLYLVNDFSPPYYLS